MKTKHYIISGPFAATKNIPTSVVAIPLVETPKALYLYGRGEVDPEGTCCKCGRRLTHPGSILLGIGPECLGSWEARDIRLSQVSEDDKQYMRSLIRSKKIDCWLPKSVIKDEFETDEIINPPKDHPMLNGKKSKSDVARAATKVKFQNSGKPAIKITFPFNVDDLNKVKTLPGRRFHDEGKSKYWSCPLTVEAVEALQGWGFEMDPDLTEFLEHTKISLTDLSDDFHIKGLQKELFPFQKKGVAFIEAKDGRALIADSMGLGKTAQALAWLQMHPEKRPVIVVVPASLKLNWEKEAGMWMERPNVQILSGKKVTTPIIGEIIIINYDILPAWYGRLSQIKAQVLIADEAHYIKNNSAKRTKTVKALAKNIPHIIALTGTPIVNRPVEAYNAISMIDSTVVPNFWTYAQRYCGAKHNGYGWDFSGATRTDELHEKLISTCLSYESIIYLPTGPKQIGEVVENGIKEKVLSYNIKTSKIQWKQIQSFSTRPMPNRTVRIVHEFGELHCTPDHRIWTKEKGYIRAEQVTTDFSLLVLPTKENSMSRFIKNKCQILFNSMRSKTSSRNRYCSKENEVYQMGDEKNQIPTQEMSKLRKSTSDGKQNLSYLETGKILLNKMRCAIQGTKSNKGCFRRPSKSLRKAQRKNDEFFRKGVKKFRRGWKTKTGYPRECGNQTQTIRSTEKTMVKNTNSKKNPSELENIKTCKKTTPKTKLAGKIFRIPNIFNTNNWPFSKRKNISSLCRFGIPENKTCNRNRWNIAPHQTTKSKRSMERKETIRSRVVSIEVLESRNRPKHKQGSKRNYVYDIQVKDNNNFFANNCLVHNCMLRRLKKNVLQDLPDKIHSFLPIELSNSKEYQKAEKDFIAWLREKRGDDVADKASNAAALAEIEGLKQLACKGKLNQAIEWIRDAVETNGKLVIFAVHKFVIDALMNEFGEIAVKVDGSVTGPNREKAVQDFQTNENIRIFVGNVKAAGVGLTLTASSTVVFLELPWSPGDLNQAEDRCHRIGQKNAVTIYYLLAERTIEEKIAKMLDRKRKVLDSVLDGKETEQESLLSELINAYREGN
jgi:hypothetical protein